MRDSCFQRFRRFYSLLQALGLVVLLAAQLAAQGGKASLTGTITDASGGNVPGVAVTVTNSATGVALTAVSNEVGVYVFPFLNTGSYTISAKKEGFRVETRADLAGIPRCLVLDA